MGLFDSADELQRRMRNQRKDDSVLKHMEETSSGIEPNEFVWAEDGEFQRIRDIYATPSIDGSPVSLPAAICVKPSLGWGLALTMVVRIERLQVVVTRNRSAAAVLRQLPRQARFAREPRLELRGRLRPGTSVVGRMTMTSSVTRRELNPVSGNLVLNQDNTDSP